MSLSFTYAAMNGGKSTLLLQNAYSSRSRGFEVVILGFKGNTREASISSRLGVETKVDLYFSEATDMKKEINKKLARRGRHKVLEVLVDEAQFLTPRQVEDLLLFTLETGVEVRCYGLKTNFETKAFPGAQRLLELADELVELDLVRCRCGKKARINARFHSDTNELITSGPEQLIEGSQEAVVYDPVCASCFVALGGSLHST